MDHKKQPYDTSLKSLLQEQASEVLPLLIEGAQFIGELNTDVFKPQAALRADKAFWLFYEGLMHLFHMEIEARADSDIRYRMLTYHALLYSKYKSPVISLILYPFRTNIPEPPLIEISAGREVLKFWYHTLPLWEVDARQYLDGHALAMYPLLPTMKGANADMVLQAIDEMVKEYTGDNLSRRLSWLDTLLERADILPDSEKHKVEEHLHMFDELLEENKHLREIAERLATKKAAKLVAEVTNQMAAREMQGAVMEVLQARFPQLASFGRTRVSQINEARMLHTLITQVAIAPDEEAVRTILNNTLL